VVELLIERGAPLKAKRQGGATPLRVAFRCLEQQSEWTPNESALTIAKALIEAGASVGGRGPHIDCGSMPGTWRRHRAAGEACPRRRETEGPGSRGL
jgi:hypothetical protein